MIQIGTYVLFTVSPSLIRHGWVSTIYHLGSENSLVYEVTFEEDSLDPEHSAFSSLEICDQRFKWQTFRRELLSEPRDVLAKYAEDGDGVERWCRAVVVDAKVFHGPADPLDDSADSTFLVKARMDGQIIRLTYKEVSSLKQGFSALLSQFLKSKCLVIQA